jgi:hypothetical protein
MKKLDFDLFLADQWEFRGFSNSHWWLADELALDWAIGFRKFPYPSICSPLTWHKHTHKRIFSFLPKTLPSVEGIRSLFKICKIYANCLSNRKYCWYVCEHFFVSYSFSFVDNKKGSTFVEGTEGIVLPMIRFMYNVPTTTPNSKLSFIIQRC